MKHPPMSQQVEALRRMNGRDEFALLMEQGTGKTYVILADAERLYCAGKIDALLVLAPKGVHTNWVLREIPEHLSVEHIAVAWKSGAGKREMERINAVMTPRGHGEIPPLRILAMNIDAIITKPGFNYAFRFLNATKAMIVADESDLLKNPAATRTKQALELRQFAVCARIATGTPITQAPLDIFAQMQFLRSGLLGTTSYRAFTAEFAEVIPDDHPMLKRLALTNPKARFAQIVSKDEDGNPRWRNLDKLQTLLAPHSYRVLKSECMDLPEKIFQTVFFDLTPTQRRAYDLLERECRIELEDGSLTPVRELAARMKLQQVTSGFIHDNNGNAILQIAGDNPRLTTLLDIVERTNGKIIVWAKFREEIRQISTALRAAGRRVVEYYGETSDEDREAAVDALQKGDAEIFVGNAQTGGVGLTLTAAETTIYYSNDWKLRTRLQSEDRNHRKGTKNNVVYIDIVATDTIDQSITRALQRKTSIAAAILDDRGLRFRGDGG